MKKVLFIFLTCCTLVKASAQTGIGTTVPVNKFQVETTVADPLTSGNNLKNGHFRLSGIGVTHIVDAGLMSTTSNYGTWIQARKKDDYSVNYNLLLNPNGGNVGIGKTAPSTALDVNGTITANAFSGTWSGTTITVPFGGTGVSTTSANYIFAGPNGSSGVPSFRALVSADIPIQEATDEYTATAGQTIFTLTNQKSSRSVYKLFINGVRISNTAYSVSTTTFTYIPANNSSYSLIAGDRVQIDYFY